MSTHPFQQSEEYRAMTRIHRLWVDLSVAVNNVLPGQSIAVRRATPPWESNDANVMAAWHALTSPENLDDLLEWGSGDLNEHARACTEKAIEECGRRRALKGEPCAAPNGGPTASVGNSGGAEGPPSVS